MTRVECGRCLERILSGSLVPRLGREALIAVPDATAANLLANEIARIAGAHPGNELIVIVDAHTASQVGATDAARTSANKVFLFGDPPRAWASAANVMPCDFGDEITVRDRFLVVLSDYFSAAMVGAVSETHQEGLQAFRGIWTFQRAYVEAIARELAGGSASIPDYDELTSDAVERNLCQCSKMVNILTEHMASLSHDAAMDKDDLASVLEILKAISSRRRSHDVLFVFVEQIARVVQVRRCSVVRVWGDEKSGHVLASHDDEHVSDLPITLAKYPELERSVDTGKRVVINQVSRDPLTRDFAEELEGAEIRSLLVVPIVMCDPNVGTLLLRVARGDRPFTMREIGFCEIVAEAASNALERAYLFETIQKANERLEHLAVTDGLTNLHNHRYFRGRLDDEFERASRYNLPLSVMIFDLDNFKHVNDNFGHLQGDSILKEIADRSLEVIRKSDLIARYGGEEFVVVMPQTGAEGALAQGERLRVELGKGGYEGLPEDYPMSVSVGVGVFQYGEMKDSEELIRTADKALYKAKRSGRNKVCLGSNEEKTSD